MHAYICDPTDAAVLARFKGTLHGLGAEILGDYGSSLDVQLVEVRIGSDVLHVFADNWSVDIEGTPELVERVLVAMKEGRI